MHLCLGREPSAPETDEVLARPGAFPELGSLSDSTLPAMWNAFLDGLAPRSTSQHEPWPAIDESGTMH